MSGDTLSTDQSEQPMTRDQREIVLLVNFVFICTFLCLFGICTNLINIIIFCKQGFAYTMNISLCGLTISDLVSLVTQLWVNVCFNPLLRKAEIPFVPEEVQYLTGTLPSVCFARINAWITVFITAERCLGIAMPLKVKRIITPQRTTVIMGIIYMTNILSMASEYHTFTLDWVLSLEKNRTLYRIVTNTPDYIAGILTYILYILIGLVSFIAVIIFTIILVVKLSQKSAWRRQATLNNETSAAMSNRDQRTVKMVVLIACLMIACYTPETIVAMVMALEPGCRQQGKYKETFYALLSIGFIFQNVNSSVNIFLYYNMSSKYRQTFREFFRIGESKKDGDLRLSNLVKDRK